MAITDKLEYISKFNKRKSNKQIIIKGNSTIAYTNIITYIN